jgi:hypothetical protein
MIEEFIINFIKCMVNIITDGEKLLNEYGGINDVINELK